MLMTVLKKKVAFCDKRKITVPSGGFQEDSVAMEVQHPKRWNLESPSRYLARVSVYEGEKKVGEYDTPFHFSQELNTQRIKS